MKRLFLPAVALVLPLLVLGCSNSGNSAGGAASQGNPAKAVFDFLEAVRTGNEEQTAGLLTPLAKEKTRQLDMVVAPPGSETASFRVGKARMIETGTAEVESSWTDLDETGSPHTDDIVWRVRKMNDGTWLIAGMSARIFPDQPPVFMNFENPEDMIRQQERVAAEMARRTADQTLEARKPDDVFKSGPK